MDNLSSDLLGMVFKQLDALTLCNLAKVSKDFAVVANSDDIWIEAHGSQKLDTKLLLLRLTTELNTSRVTCEQIGVVALAAISDCNGNPFRDADSESRVRARANAERKAWSKAGDIVDKNAIYLSIGYRVLGLPLKLRRDLRDDYGIMKNGKTIRAAAAEEAHRWERREHHTHSLSRGYGVAVCCKVAVSLGFP